MTMHWPHLIPLANPYRGLGRRAYGGSRRLVLPSSPLGWRWLRDWHRNSAVELPLWLYWPVRLRREWQSVVFPALMRCGLWAVDVEGGYYIADGRPTLPRWLRRVWWCFLNDADRCPA